MAEINPEYVRIYFELFDEYIEQGYYEDVADIMATREAGIKMGFGPSDLFW